MCFDDGERRGLVGRVITVDEMSAACRVVIVAHTTVVANLAAVKRTASDRSIDASRRGACSRARGETSRRGSVGVGIAMVEKLGGRGVVVRGNSLGGVER